VTMRRPRPDLRQRLAAHLRRLRTARGHTQEQTAARAGLNLRHYQKCEAGEINATLRTLERLAAALGVDPRDLVTP
jgi:transcriptional regulator with XRE-family HTH domain